MIDSQYKVWTDECKDITDDRIKWEYIKCKIKHVSVRYGQEKAKNSKKKERDLNDKLNELTIKIETNDNNEEYENEKVLVETELRELDQYKLEGIIMRSKCLWYEKGEKSNKYFLNIIKQNKIKTTMNKLKTDNGEIVYNSNDILKHQAIFYEDLYKDHNFISKEQICEYIKDINVPNMCDELKEQCEGLLSEEECYSSIKSFGKGKTPGIDGITTEFYQKFWYLIKNNFVNSFNMAFTKGQLTETQKLAVIILLDKGKDRTLLQNWRPISLLNVDYKIVTKVIAMRFKHLLPNLINRNQVGYVKGRTITENIRLISDIMFFTKECNLPGILINVDFSKAFDSVNWLFLYETLKKFNFGPSFIKWIKLFYSDVKSCISNNGNLSRSFKLERGVRQGDPLSPYLFILVVELLASVVRSDKLIKGLTVNDYELKLVQYADDITGCLSDVASAKQFLHVIKVFGKYSGLKLNNSKTEGMWLGSLRQCTNTPLNISWPQKPLRFLGVYLSYDQHQCENFNFTEKIRKCKQILTLWRTRDLSLYGKVQVVKTFIISQFLYVTSAIFIPDCYVNDINKMIIDFIWSGRKPKLKRDVLFLPKNQGGLGLPDFSKMVHVTYIKWLKLYNATHDALWKQFFTYFVSVRNYINLDVLLKSNFSMNHIKFKFKIPQFYYQMLHVWSIYGENVREKRLLLWYNPILKVDKKMFFYEELYKVGVMYVSDLFNATSEPISFNEWIRKGVPQNKWLQWRSLISCCSQAFKDKDLSLPDKKIKADMRLYFNDILLDECSKQSISLYIITKKFGIDYVHVPNIEVNVGIGVKPDWKMLFLFIYKYIPDTKLRDFQFKLYHNILINNYKLHLWKLRDNAICDLCEEAIETTQHVFWECKTNVTFLEMLKTFCFRTFDLILTKDIYFTGSDDELVYHILALAKKYTYNRRYQIKVPEWEGFKHYIYYKRNLEFEIAKANNSVEKYICKWERYM